jgi:hypothetical protein
VGIITAEDVLVVCPGRDHAVGVGDRFTVLDKPEDVEKVGVARSPVGRARGARTPTRRILRRFSRTLAEEADRAVCVTVLLGVPLLPLSTVVLRLGYVRPGAHHLSIEDAMYFTVETVATVGYGDFSFGGQPAWLEGGLRPAADRGGHDTRDDALRAADQRAGAAADRAVVEPGKYLRAWTTM